MTEQEFRQEHPEMFTHPDSLPGELYWMSYPHGTLGCSNPAQFVEVLKQQGLSTARYGDTYCVPEGGIPFTPIFISITEYLEKVRRSGDSYAA